MIFSKKDTNENKKGEGMEEVKDKKESTEKKLRDLLGKPFKKDSKEINHNLDQLILGQIDDLQYALDTNAGLKEEDTKALSVLISARDESKKTHSEIVKNIAQTLGITVTAAASIVGIIYTIKGFNFDKEWMQKIFDFKDSLNVMDAKSFNQVNRNREGHRKMAEHMLNNKIHVK